MVLHEVLLHEVSELQEQVQMENDIDIRKPFKGGKMFDTKAAERAKNERRT